MNARWLWSVAGLLVLLGTTPAFAQLDDEPYEKPVKPADFWRAFKYERAQGKFDVAAVRLRGFLDSKPTDADYAAIEADEGIVTFLRLRRVPQWSADKEKEKAARQTVETIIRNATDAVNRTLSDPVLIKQLVGNLSASPEEQEYALTQLIRSGVKATPIMLEMLADRRDPDVRDAILRTLPKLPPATVPPIIAALDSNDRDLKSQLIGALAERPDLYDLTGTAESNVLPALAYLSTTPTEGGAVRTVAGKLRKQLRERLRLKDIPARNELIESAEAYLNHRVKFGDPVKVTVWRWDGTTATPADFTTTQAEEYFGLRNARRALELSSPDEPAQVTFITLALDKAIERAGLATPLSKAAPEAYDLLTAASPALLRAVLDRALLERRTGVALNVIRALGDRGEVALANVQKEPRFMLVRALDYPDRRVQLAAAEALAKAPPSVEHQSHVRIVEILRRGLAAEPEPGAREADKPKVLIGDPDGDRAAAMARLAREAGYSPVLVGNGRDAVRRLLAASDIDIVLVDHQLAGPELPDLFAQVRTDPRMGGLPIRVMLASPADPARLPDPEARVRRLAKPYRGIEVVREPFSPGGMASTLQPVPEKPAETPLTAEERRSAAKRAVETLRMLAAGPKPGYDVRPAVKELVAALRDDELALAALEAIERFDGREIQAELANVVSNAARPEPLRVRAAEAIIASAQRDGLLIGEGPQKLIATSIAEAKADSDLRAKVSALLARGRTDPKTVGERLLRYTPPDPTAPAPAPMPAPPKE